jgi:acyl-coenzyme A thioesterase PaaI-like protein
LNSIHAIALINLAELASGLAMLSGLPPTARGIVTHIEMDYEKKARGMLTVRSTARAPGLIDCDMQHTVEAEIFDAEGDRVAVGRILWQLGPKPEVQA